MSRQINQPINQVRLTNVAVVRMNMGGKRFEIACYRNKVVNYRQGLEKDMGEVLQSERIFTNVSKGQFAKAKDLQKCFNTKDEEEIAKLILTKGQLQVSDKERNQQLEKTTAQIADWVSKNCVHADGSNRPFTTSQIRHAMQTANFSVHPTKSLKPQYLDCVKLLQTVIPIQRARMELALYCPSSTSPESSQLEQTLHEHHVQYSKVSFEYEFQYKVQVDPSLYRVLNSTIHNVPGGRIEVITQVVTQQGDGDLATTATTGPLEEMQHGDLVSRVAGRVEEGANKNYDDDEDEDGFLLVKNAAKTLNELNLDDDDNDDDDNEGEKDDYNNVDITQSNEGDDEEVEEENMNSASQRKTQKKARKKDRKARRREGEALSEQSQVRNTQREHGIESVTSTAGTANATTAAPPSTVRSNGNTNSNDSEGSRKSCNTCGGYFDSAADFRAHFKSDWHRFNQKLKLKGAAPISEQEFLMCDSESFFGQEM